MSSHVSPLILFAFKKLQRIIKITAEKLNFGTYSGKQFLWQGSFKRIIWFLLPFYLSDTAFSLLPLLFWANEITDYLNSDRFDLLSITEHDISIVCCLFFDAIVLTLHLTRGSSSIRLQVTGWCCFCEYLLTSYRFQMN